jgi:hypothetical protein
MDAGLGRGGMDAGLGRGGMPGWLGRGIADGVGRAAPPPETPNGLLPGPRAGGRGLPPAGPGRGPPPGADGPPVRGLAAGEPGRGGTEPGPGRGPGPVGRISGCGCWARRSASRVRAACAALTAASCSALSAEARASAAATSMSWALAGLATGPGVGPGRTAGGLGRTNGPGDGAGEVDALLGALGALGASAAGAAGRRGGCGRAPVDGAGRRDGDAGALDADGADAAGAEPASRAPRNRRATGASTVLEADLTNSPISLSLARTVLLSTPSSFASSCTRALPGTALLTSRSCERTRNDLTRALEACSFQGLHRVLIWVVLPCWVVIGPGGLIIGRSARHGDRTDVLGERTGVSNTGESQRPPEGTASLRLREASRIRMQMRSPARQSAVRIGLEAEIIPAASHDEPN